MTSLFLNPNTPQRSDGDGRRRNEPGDGGGSFSPFPCQPQWRRRTSQENEMTSMAAEAQRRGSGRDFGPDDEADAESYMEDSGGELAVRLRELEAENSALMLANESQREAYERCLDEVANHVVQALLNQKDLREECIKLKMLVFDLEKQNRALCELFQQKLPDHPAAHYQVRAGPLPDDDAQPAHDSAPHSEAAQTQAQAKGDGRSSPGPRSPAPSMEALSPFFKKKARILEVLRKMEETDPLKFHPVTAGLSFRDYGRALASAEAALAEAEALRRESRPARCHCPRPDALRRVNGDGGRACCFHCNGCPEGSLKPRACATRSRSAPAADGCCAERREAERVPPSDGPQLDGFCPAPELDPEVPEPGDSRTGPSLDGADPPGPIPSCLGEVKSDSPSKLLKFLKIPPAGDGRQDSGPAVRLSPQLTRSSRIPCRSNNYEVYRSPVPTRRATTTERCGPPPPPPPARSESYPAARSAPTSPPQADAAHPASVKDGEIAARPPEPARGIPHYENVCGLSPAHALEKRSTLPSQSKGERKLVQSLPESVLVPPAQKKHSSSSASESASDDDNDDDDDVPLWANHHSLPNSLALGRARPRIPEEEEEEAARPALPARRNDSSSIPKRPAAKSQADSGRHAFQERLAALGKLRSSEEADASDPRKTAERRAADAEPSDGRPGRPGSTQPGRPGSFQPASRAGADGGCPGSLHLACAAKGGPQSGGAPNRVPPKSPSKPCGGLVRAGKGADAPRYSSKSEERAKRGERNPTAGDSLPPPPPPPRPAAPAEGEDPAPAPAPRSAIEQKVMRGIRENALKLQEQDRGGPRPAEARHKASNGIAGWFGRKKSKLPALSRKADGAKAREWKINIPSAGGRGREGLEGLNISTLMEKAEGLRRALEEERAYVERSARGRSCEVLLDQAQGQLAVVYRGGRSDGFMRQLLNRWTSGTACCRAAVSSYARFLVSVRACRRGAWPPDKDDAVRRRAPFGVDGKEDAGAPRRRLCFDRKTAGPVFPQQSDAVLAHAGDDVETASHRLGQITSDENLTQRFSGSGASTYTLDSGIGTFPLPDGGATGRGPSKSRAEQRPSGSPGRAGRRARTLDREPASQDDCEAARKRALPDARHLAKMEARGSAGVLGEDQEAPPGARVFSPRSKTWTFPNLKTPAGPAVEYLAVEEEEREAATFGTPFRAGSKAGGPSSSRAGELGGPPAPAPSGPSRRGKTRAPAVAEMSRDAGLELLRERPEEAPSPGRPRVPETPESLSDSLYDSLSSCGSQG
ncbi:nck-associated protein 5-like isoform X1 [Hippocampus zosterae]|uniref:nck-associated protein 5-like isoform X1 n=1 Tax=Hippocampus zosterae TaxID=109293 RepID=UPI00223E4AAF|nr:nck-associated protein 5-like isoform X1 [Hippocampus zosterae]